MMIVVCWLDALMKALAAGKDGFTYLSRTITVLLQTLLQDQIAEVGQPYKMKNKHFYIAIKNTWNKNIRNAFQ